MSRCCCDYENTVIVKIPTRNSFYKFALGQMEKDELVKQGQNFNPPITGHLNKLTYVVINNIEAKNLRRKMYEDLQYSCNKNYITQKAYNKAIDSLLLKKPSTYAQLFGSAEELNSVIRNSDGSLNKLAFVQTDILHNCGIISSVMKESGDDKEYIHIRINKNDKYFDLIMKAAGKGDIYANARYMIFKNHYTYQKKNIYDNLSIVTFDIILPSEYYCEYEKARISELKIGKD